MSTNKMAWGIEVGSQAIKVMKLARTATGVALEDFDVLPFKQVLTTPDLNVEEAIRVNLESLAQKHEFDKSTVVVSVPGNMAFARFAKLPPIEPSKVKSIVAYEAQQQIPFPIGEVEWDYEVFTQDDAPDIEVGIFAITKERVAHFLSNYRAVNVRVDTLTLSPVAVYNAFAYENQGGSGYGDNTVYLDIGTNSTDIIVVESGSIWLRTLQLGGNHFTQALMKQFKISFAKAEKLKLEAATSKYAKQIFQAMRGVFSELVTEVQRSLGFYTSLNRDAELTRIVGVGSTWKLPGLQKFLKQNLQMEVVRPSGFSQLQIEDRRAAEFASVAINMTTAYGLALQGLGLGEVNANILPQSILQQRMWKAKQPWIGAAAACVAVAPLIGLGMLMLRDNSYSASLSAAKPGINETLATAQQLKQQYDTVQTNDPRPGITNYRRSFDYINLVPGLMQDVAKAMATIEPHPAVKQVDWNNPADIENLARLSRSERKLVWITGVQTRYLPPVDPLADSRAAMGDAGASGPTAEFGSTGPDAGIDAGRVRPALTPTIGFPQATPASAGEATGGTPQQGQPSPGRSIKEDKTSPRVTVTVRGTATMDRATISRLLQEKFVGWLKANRVRGDRPYIIIPELANPRFTRRSGAQSDESSRDEGGLGGGEGLRRTPTPQPTDSSPRPTPVPGTLPTPGGLGLPGGDTEPQPSREAARVIEVQTPEGWYASLGGANAATFSANALLPRRPLSTEDVTQDTTFTFSFDVILLPPDKARSTILHQPEAGPEDGDGTDTPSPQAGPNQHTNRTEDRA